jgi:uncharacterized damage-inducible protein DinB
MIREVLLAEFDHEMAQTRRVLERCPPGFDWTPHARSFTLGDLATHLSRLPHWGERILSEDGYDLTRDSAPQPPSLGTLPAVLDALDRYVRIVRAALVASSDAELAAPWSLRRNGEALMTLPRLSAFKTFVVNHTIHHRGQLTVYLRLLDIPLPAIYGPTADEPL